MTAWTRLSRYFLVVLLFGCAKHLDLYEGIRSFKAQDYRSAFVRLMPEARKGQPDAEYAVGFMYYYGQGVVENRKKALYWIRKAACHGQPEALEAAKLIQDEAACSG